MESGFLYGYWNIFIFQQKVFPIFRTGRKNTHVFHWYENVFEHMYVSPMYNACALHSFLNVWITCENTPPVLNFDMFN